MLSKDILYCLLFILAACVGYFLISTPTCVPAQREIAITIDDLPLTNNNQTLTTPFDKIVQSLLINKAPAIGFVIANRVDTDAQQALKDFQERGFLIGNHSYSHMSLNTTLPDLYIEDIARADKILTPFMPDTKYYRYPYLSKGKWKAKQKVFDYLAANNYIIAPVTIDSRDFVLNAELLNSKERDNTVYLNHIKKRYLNFVWKQTLKAEKEQNCKITKQILLLHANILNSYFLDDLLKMYRSHGYRFITLEEALKQ